MKNLIHKIAQRIRTWLCRHEWKQIRSKEFTIPKNHSPRMINKYVCTKCFAKKHKIIWIHWNNK